MKTFLMEIGPTNRLHFGVPNSGGALTLSITVNKKWSLDTRFCFSESRSDLLCYVTLCHYCLYRVYTIPQVSVTCPQVGRPLRSLGVFLAGTLVLPCLTEDQPLLIQTVGSLEKQPYNSNQPQHNIRYTLPGKLTYPCNDCCCILGESGFDKSKGFDSFFKVAERSSPNTCACSLIFCLQKLKMRLKIRCTVNTLCPA